MRQLKIFFFSLSILFVFTVNSFSQSGELYLKNYKHPFHNLDNQNLAILQDKSGVMYFANTKGVLMYNGVHWDLVETQNTPFSLGLDPKSNKVYVGCKNGFGYLKKDDKGRTVYVKLSDNIKNKNLGEFRQIKVIDKSIYFYSKKVLVELDLANQKVSSTWWSKSGKQFSGFLFLGKHLYLNYKEKGLHKISGKTSTLVDTTNQIEEINILDFEKYNNTQVIFTASDGWVYLFDGRKNWKFEPGSKDYLHHNIPSILLNLPNKQLAIGTLSGGCMIIKKDNQITQFLINYQNHLPDDEILALGYDIQGGLWICHNEGITRVDFKLPIRNFSSYGGLDGNITSVVEFQDSLFVSTSIGLFYLSKVDNFKEVESLIRRESKYLKRVETITREKIIKDKTPQQNIRLYRHPAMEEEDEELPERLVEENEKVEVELIPSKVVTSERRRSFFESDEAREVYATSSMKYVYKEVEDVHARCKQLLPFGNRLLVASNLGLYEVKRRDNKFEADLILPEQYIHFIFISKHKKNRVWVGTDDGLWALDRKDDAWGKIDLSEDIPESIYSILEHNNKIWLGGRAGVIWADIDHKKGIDSKGLKRFEFHNSYSQEVPVRLINGQVACFLNDAVYVYAKNKFVKQGKLSKSYNGNAKIFFHQPSYTWNNTGYWKTFEKHTEFLPSKLVYLKMFKDISEIYVDKKENIWFVDENQLYKLDNAAKLDAKKKFNLYFEHVKDKKDHLLSLKDLIIKYNKNTLSFSFQLASPFYLNEDDIEYQYWLEKKSVVAQKPQWSTWSKQAKVTFPFLSKGEYKLHVRAKNVFSQQSVEKVFDFEIKPPFWETWTYFLLEIGILILLLVLAYIFSRKKSNKTPWISRVLTLVTLITIFEFLLLKFEPYIEQLADGVPIIKLGMNILLALTLYPIERLLRFLLQPKNKDDDFSQKNNTDD